MASETTPLVSGGSQPTAYFLDGVHRRKPSSAGEESFKPALTREDEEVDSMPTGGEAAEFNPRPVSGRAGGAPPSGVKNRKMRKPSVGGGWIDYVVADSWRPKTAGTTAFTPSGDAAINRGEIGSLLIPRKVPIKVEPKVHFGNERTFLAWLHVVLILAAGSMTIVAYAKNDNIVNQLYGIVLLPVSIAFIFYALYQYLRRAVMINRREPGPWIDVAGPTTLTVILMATIIAQFCVQLHKMMYSYE